MSTVPLGENPYLYQGGATVPLRQQRTGGYAANSFGNRVFYTPEGRLPNTTLAPNLAPTPGTLLRQNLSGAGLAGAVIGGTLQTQAAYSQGAGLFEGIGSGAGVVVGSIGGQFAGAAAGAAAGGAVGSAVPVVGTVAGAGAGTAVGAIGGGLAGGAVGGSVGGGLGRAVDNFFWPNPADPAIGIGEQPRDAQPQSGGEAYPNEFPAGAAGAGAVVAPGTPPPFTGGQSPGVVYTISYETRSRNSTASNCGNWSNWSNSTGAIPSGQITGPITGPTGNTAASNQISIFDRTIRFDFTANGVAYSLNLDGAAERFYHSSCGPSYEFRNFQVTRADGQADIGGDPPGGIDAELAPNPARTPSRPLRSPYYPAGSGTPSTPPADRPWPERSATPVPDADPLGETSPFRSPEIAPNFTPTPNPAPTETDVPARTQPSPPFDPLNPTGPSRPLEREKERAGSPFFFIPVPIPTQPINRPDFKTPDVPVTLGRGVPQPAITPTGSPSQLINPTANPTPNPNVNPQIEPVQQPARVEEGKCCIPPANPDIVKRLEEIKKGIGFDGLPVSVPDQIAKQNPLQLSVGSLAELHLWQVQQLDGVMGRWPQQIPIPTPAGPVNVGMPNMAEAVAEMVGMMVSQQVTAAQILNTSSRTLAQSGSATQQAHLAHLTAKANADFLGYESRANAVDMPLAYTPGADPFDGFLTESTAKVQGFQNTDKTDIKAIFAELLQAAAIIRAVYWRKLDTKGDLKKQIRDNISGQGDFIDKAAAGDGKDSDWEAYLKQVEEGFRSATGDDTPYGRNQSEGPKIKDRSPKKDKD
jgi:hypothetical protein